MCHSFLSSHFLNWSRLTFGRCRARELEAEQQIGARYRPPALRALASGGSPPNEHPPSTTTPIDTPSALPPTNYPPGFRRARAGTLPSNVQLAAQRFAAASSSLSNAPSSTDSFTEQVRQQRDLVTPTATSAAAPVRPGLRHSASVASSVASSALTERNSRLRSGSLTTLPTGGLSNAFGPSIFSSSWLSTRVGGNGLPTLDDMAMDSGADEFDVHTLDYLGLDDGLRHPPAATLSELRNQAQAAITVNLNNPSRVRASTVSVPYHLRPSAKNSLLSTPSADDEEEIYENDLYHSQGLDSYGEPDNGNYLSANYITQGLKQSDHLGVGLGTRPRAISVGNLDDSASRASYRRAGMGDLTPTYAPEVTLHNALASGLNPAGILRTDKINAPRTGLAASVHFPNPEPATMSRAAQYLAAPSSQNRAVSPKSENSSTQMQTPTRSLWIGNLDSSFTSEQLIHVFAPYGAIESLRLLPEKVRDWYDLRCLNCCLCSLTHRNVVSSTSWIKRMPFAPRTTCSTGLAATSACPMARRSELGLARPIVPQWLPRRVRI